MNAEPTNPEPKYTNRFQNELNLIAPYVFSLILLILIFLLFPLKKKLFMFFSFIFFCSLSFLLIWQARKSKLGEFNFLIVYLPIYLLYLFWYFWLYNKKK
ncbi:MAG: hypothetical protein MRERV_46c004 [Mycoplasmataceae bacterium RV_VA103A]|nr:MAG: hypothetical protein MRERV_46c004 [Mycoplasmataceae bacterium RV_VA103A]